MTVEQAVQALNLSWNLNHDARIQAWDQQVAQDAVALEAQRQQQQQEAEAQAAQELLEQEAERAEAKKKKPKMRDFDEAATIGSFIASGPRPAQYALCWIEEFEYVELWYLTPEGCADATQRQLTQNDDTFGLTKVDES
jgi:ATP/maltotriose-dependent transcriptional regulator MalT